MKRVPRPWVTGIFLLLATLAALVPAEILEYNRARVGAGELWRLGTGQLVHWAPRMAFFDLGVILVLGCLLELTGARRALTQALCLSLLATAVTVHTFQSQLASYRGSSGIATALFAVVVLRGASDRSALGRTLLILSVIGFGAKIALEFNGSQPLFVGALSEGVVVSPAVHAAGLTAGLIQIVWGGVGRLVQRLKPRLEEGAAAGLPAAESRGSGVAPVPAGAP